MLLILSSETTGVLQRLPIIVSSVSAMIGLTALMVQVYIHLLSGPRFKWDRELFPVMSNTNATEKTSIWLHRLRLTNKGRKAATKVFISIVGPTKIIDWKLQQPTGAETDRFKSSTKDLDTCDKLALEAERCLARATLVIELWTRSADSLVLTYFSNELPANKIRKVDDLPLKGAERAISWPLTVITAVAMLAVFYLFRLFR